MQETVRIKNNKGLHLATIVEKPEGPGPFPTVLLLHGFTGYKEEEIHTDLAERFLQIGIASIRFDASGFGDSEGTLEEDYRFSNYIQDTESVYAWMQQQDFVDADKIGAAGQSMGGAQAVLFASNHPELKLAVAISSPDKVGTDDALGAVKDEWKQNGYLNQMSSRYGKKIKIPYAYLEDVMQYDFAKLAAKIECRFLVVIGEKDDIVLPAQTERVFNAAKQPKFLMRFKDMDHFYKRNEAVLQEVGEAIASFVDEFLK